MIIVACILLLSMSIPWYVVNTVGTKLDKWEKIAQYSISQLKTVTDPRIQIHILTLSLPQTEFLPSLVIKLPKAESTRVDKGKERNSTPESE